MGKVYVSVCERERDGDTGRKIERRKEGKGRVMIDKILINEEFAHNVSFNKQMP